MKPTPIIVVGKNRSGTKWVSNLLCNHPDVVAVQTPEHGGVLETNLFDQMQVAFGDLSRIENFIAFVEAWSQTDFFKATGCEKRLIYTSGSRPTDYLTVFELVMNDLATRKGARFWLQKTSPLQASMVLMRYPHCRVVLVTRDMLSTLRSGLQLARNIGSNDSLLRAVFRYILEEKLMRGLPAQQVVTSVDYSALRAHPAGELSRLCADLGIQYRDTMHALSWRPNSSFAAQDKPRFDFTAGELWLVRALSAGLSLLPVRTMAWVHARGRRKGPLFVRGSYREIQHRYSLR